MAGHGGRAGRRGAVTVAAPDPHAAMAAAGAGRGPDVFTPASTARVVLQAAGGLYLAPALVALSRTRPRSAQRVPAAAECRVQVRLAAESRASVRSWRHCAAANVRGSDGYYGITMSGRVGGRAVDARSGWRLRSGIPPSVRCPVTSAAHPRGSSSQGPWPPGTSRNTADGILAAQGRLRGRHVRWALVPEQNMTEALIRRRSSSGRHGLRTRASTGQTARSPARGSPVRDCIAQLPTEIDLPGRRAWAVARHGMVRRAREHSLDLIDGNQPGTRDPGEALRGRHPPARSRPGGDRPVLFRVPGCSDRHREASARSETGQTLLIHGAVGGVGWIAVRLAHELAPA